MGFPSLPHMALAGGHSTEILRRLSKHGRLWAFDLDPNAVAVGQRLEATEPRFTMIHRPFADVHVTWLMFIKENHGKSIWENFPCRYFLLGHFLGMFLFFPILRAFFWNDEFHGGVVGELAI